MIVSPKFEKLLRKELENRAFAIRGIKRLADRMPAADPRRVLWTTYYELEEFNVPRYAAAARRLGITYSPGIWTKAKAWAIGSTPIVLHDLLLKTVLQLTIKYLESLKELKAAGPPAENEFLQYVVDQEVVQIDMMKCGVRGSYSEIPDLFRSFKSKYGVVVA